MQNKTDFEKLIFERHRVKTLQSIIRKKDTEIGCLKSEIDHLNYLLNQNESNKDISIRARVELRKEELYNNQKEEIKHLRKKIKSLRETRDILISKKHKCKQ